MKQNQRKRRKFVSLLLALAVLLSGNGITAFAGTVSENKAMAENVLGGSGRENNVRAGEGATPANPVHNCNPGYGKLDTTMWSYIYFGSYPQTEVTDGAVIAAIEQAIDAEGSQTECGTDVWVDGVKYRRISKDDTNNDQYFGDSTYRYFKWERIKWKVLKNDGSTLFVVADQALDWKRYNDKQENITWESCTLRSWLNNGFYNTAFSNSEKSAIVNQTIVNADNPEYGTEGGNNTNDYIYLLSIGEVMNEAYGFCSDFDTESVSRHMKASDFANARGADACRSEHNDYKDNRWWWLRSPGSSSDLAANVPHPGYVHRRGRSVYTYYDGVCPALHINLSSNLWAMTDQEEPEKEKVLTGLLASKAKTVYTQGEKLNVDDIKVTAHYQSHPETELPSGSYTTNVADIDMNSTGSKQLTISYTENGITKTANITITINKRADENEGGTQKPGESSAVPVNPVHHCTKQNDGTDYTNFSYVYFGSYPQTEVTDSAVIATVERAIEAKGSQWVSDSQADGKTDVWVDGVKYRRISKSDTDHDEYFGDSSYRYFKWERIKWKVLNNNGSTLFVVADQALDWKRYNDKRENITWENCTLRSWLNSSFYNTAFSNSEQSAIVTQTVVNNNNPKYGTKGGNNTNDHIYLLSIEEVMDEAYGFCSNGDTESVSRRTKVSDFAHARGVYRRPNSGYEGNCWWWLRSPGYSVLTAALADFHGSIGTPGDYVDDIDGAVCPALHINLSSHLWTMTEEEEPEKEKILTGIQASKTKTVYTQGEKLNIDDIKVTAYYQSHPDTELPSGSYTTDAATIDMNSPGSKILKVSYTEGSITKTADIPITVSQKADENEGNTQKPGENTETPGGNTQKPGENTETPGGNTETSGGNTQKPGESAETPGENNTTPSNPVHCTNKDDGTDYTRFSYVYFGSYPQTEVTDSAVIAAIEQVIEAEGSQADCGTDVWVDGVKYRRISKSDVSSNNNFGDSDYRYFKWERIKWKVLRNDGSTLFVVADKGLDGKGYHDKNTDVTWESCTLRSWLNNSFYNTAFNDSEQGAIVIQDVVNDDNPKYGTEGGNNTKDHIYLLSIGEVMNAIESVSRRIKISDFAHAKGVFRNPNSAYEGNSGWWLRSPGGTSYYPAFVRVGGYVDEAGFYADNKYAVCPAMHINLSSHLWTMTEEEEPEKEKILTGIQASKTKTVYTQGEKLNIDDIKVTAYYQSHPDTELPSGSYTTDAAAIDMNSPGSKILKVSYTEGSITKTADIPITVSQKADENEGNTQKPGENTETPGENTETPGENNTTPSNPVHCTNKDDGTDYTRFSYVYFGSYPQTEVTDSAVIAAIEQVIEAEGSQADCGTDVWVDGVKYRRISKRDVSINNNFGDSDYRYFKWERIKWKVLRNDGNTLFVVADKGLDGKGYHDKRTDVTWESCTLRSWLNSSFYNTAFNAGEQDAIVIQDVVNDDNPKYGTEGGNNTNDHIYLLSIGEVMNEAYGFWSSGYTIESVSRRIKISDFAHAKGALRNTNSAYEGNSGWWLRSPGGTSYYPAFVRTSGYVDGAGFYADNKYAICPAMHINLSSHLWTMTEQEMPEKEKILTGIQASKTKTVYTQGEKLNIDDIKVTAYYQSHPDTELPSGSYTTDASVIDMNSPGSKILKVSYTEGSITKTADIPITVNQKTVDNSIKQPEGIAQAQMVKVTKLTITAPSKKLAAGKKVKLTVKVSPQNASNKEVTWKTSNKKYATVNEKDGWVTLKKAGIGKTVTITAIAKDKSGVKVSYKIKIMKHAVKSIKLKAPAKTLKAGTSMKVKATVKTTGKSANKTLKWKSSNTKYAIVDKSGKVTAKKAGKGKNVTITAISTDGSGKKEKVKIKIK